MVEYFIIGASPIPSAGLVFILMIMDTVGVPNTALFGIVIAVDFIIDRFVTSCNVSGDLYCASVINHWNPNILETEEAVEDMKKYENQIEHAHDETV